MFWQAFTKKKNAMPLFPFSDISGRTKSRSRSRSNFENAVKRQKSTFASYLWIAHLLCTPPRLFSTIADAVQLFNPTAYSSHSGAWLVVHCFAISVGILGKHRPIFVPSGGLRSISRFQPAWSEEREAKQRRYASVRDIYTPCRV